MSAGGAVVAEADGPGANIATIQPGVVDRRLAALLGALGAARPVACCAGAAGAEVPQRREWLIRSLEARLPGCRVQVVHDSRLVLAAAGLDEGIALIAGTGSVAYARTADGREAQAGGWGWMLGDVGSAVWVVREAAREVMRRADAGAPPGMLGEKLMAACHARSARELTARLHSLREPMRWASLAGSVFDAADGDAGASEVVERGAEGLFELARMVRDTVGVNGPIVLAGGLLLNQPRLESRLRQLFDAPCMRLDEPPVAGAVKLAERLIPA